MEKTKLNPSHYLTIISITIGLISLSVNVWQYIENREMRANQAELTALQLEKARNEKAAKQPATRTA